MTLFSGCLLYSPRPLSVLICLLTHLHDLYVYLFDILFPLPFCGPSARDTERQWGAPTSALSQQKLERYVQLYARCTNLIQSQADRMRGDAEGVQRVYYEQVTAELTERRKKKKGASFIWQI